MVPTCIKPFKNEGLMQAGGSPRLVAHIPRLFKTFLLKWFYASGASAHQAWVASACIKLFKSEGLMQMGAACAWHTWPLLT